MDGSTAKPPPGKQGAQEATSAASNSAQKPDIHNIPRPTLDGATTAASNSAQKPDIQHNIPRPTVDGFTAKPPPGKQGAQEATSAASNSAQKPDVHNIPRPTLEGATSAASNSAQKPDVHNIPRPTVDGFTAKPSQGKPGLQGTMSNLLGSAQNMLPGNLSSTFSNLLSQVQAPLARPQQALASTLSDAATSAAQSGVQNGFLSQNSVNAISQQASSMVSGIQDALAQKLQGGASPSNAQMQQLNTLMGGLQDLSQLMPSGSTGGVAQPPGYGAGSPLHSEATSAASHASPTSVASSASSAMSTGQSLLSGASNMASLLQGVGGPLGKAALRFTPALNIPMALSDAHSFMTTMRNPNASMGQKMTSGVTAAGSLIGASNIPGVSQLGATVATAASLLGPLVEKHRGASPQPAGGHAQTHTA